MSDHSVSYRHFLLKEIKDQIMSTLHFKEGKLLVRYLGLPLISGNLIAQDWALCYNNGEMIKFHHFLTN